jgi:hypothetical protein
MHKHKQHWLVVGQTLDINLLKPKKIQGENKSGKADMALSYIPKLYGIESKIK